MPSTLHPSGPAGPQVVSPSGGVQARTGPAPSQQGSSRHSPKREQHTLTAAGLTVILVGVLLPMIDFFIVNVALPTIDRDLRASQPLLELVVSGYATAYALLLVLGGRLGDSVGRKRLFMIGMAAFTATSLACGLAPTAAILVVGRIAQDASAALMVPQVLATIQAATTGERRARALGRYGATGGLAAVLGQVLGGLLVSANIDGLSWRPIFLVNVPIGLAGLVLAKRYVPDTRHGAPAPIDGPGTMLLGLTVLALLVPLTEGRTLRWPAWTVALLVLVPFAAAAFGRYEQRAERAGRVPLVPPSLLQHRSMRHGLMLALPFFAGFGAFMFCYALLVQDGLHASALIAGLGLVPMAATFLFASLSTSRLLAAYGAKVLTAGGLLQAAGLIILGLTVYLGWPHLAVVSLAPALAVAGFGQGLVMSPLFGTVLSEVPPASAGAGSGVLTTTQQTALALGVATLGSLFLSLVGEGRAISTAFIVVIAIQTVVAIGIAAGARGLPGWRALAQAPQVAAELAVAGATASR